MKKLISLELKKMNIKKFALGVGIANIAIAILVTMMAVMENVSGGELPSISTATMIDTLVKATFIVWEAILIANLIIEEYRSKTILLLFSYPIDRKKTIISKLIIIVSLILGGMIVSQIIQNVLFFVLSQFVDIIIYSITLKELFVIFVTSITSILLGLLPMYVGMLNKSTVATVVSSILIVSLTISSGGQDGGGLITVLPVSITMGVAGVVLAYMAMKKMLAEDIIL